MQADLNGEVDFNEESLGRFLTKRLGADCGTYQLSRINGGQSNPTYFLNWGEQNLVLRKQPNGPILRGAHAVDREYKVLEALHPTLFLCLSRFYIVLSQSCWELPFI